MQKTGEEIIFFQYGAGGVPLGFVYNGVQYFYVTNQLGDVLGITDATGKAIVEYTYDEWGNPIQTITRDNTEEQNKIAQLNPLRYRGYYYDAETGYYYLQSRYYNPKWGRFISADSFSYIDAFTRLGFNAYIYCANNPIMFVDPSGTEKTNNVAEVIFKSLVIFIEVDWVSKIFTGLAQIADISINKIFEISANIDIKDGFNNWFEAMPKANQKTFGETVIFLITGMNDLFDDIDFNIAQSGLLKTLDTLIKDPFQVLSQFPKLSTVFSKIKYAPTIFDSIFSISSVIEDAHNKVLDSLQSGILIVYNIINTILGIIPQTSYIAIFGKIAISFTDIFFKYVNGHFI